MEGLIAITYRCNAHCRMCNTWRFPSQPETEIRPADLESLPRLRFANITGGEPFIRADIADFVEILREKAARIVVSTNGYLTERVVRLAERFPDVGLRVSLEGLGTANDELRGLDRGFEHGLRTLLALRDAGVRDIGFGITLTDRNADDVMELYTLAEGMGLEFATAAAHNTYYFHKLDNRFDDPDRVCAGLEAVARRLLATNRMKNWFRAWFNVGLANYVKGGPRLLPCDAAQDVFFVDPFGDVKPCNAMDFTLGNLREEPFARVWGGSRAAEARRRVRECTERCWMIGSVAPAMRRHLSVPAVWVLKAKLTGTLPGVRGA